MNIQQFPYIANVLNMIANATIDIKTFLPIRERLTFVYFPSIEQVQDTVTSLFNMQNDSHKNALKIESSIKAICHHWENKTLIKINEHNEIKKRKALAQNIYNNFQLSARFYTTLLHNNSKEFGIIIGAFNKNTNEFIDFAKIELCKSPKATVEKLYIGINCFLIERGLLNRTTNENIYRFYIGWDRLTCDTLMVSRNTTDEKAIANKRTVEIDKHMARVMQFFSQKAENTPAEMLVFIKSLHSRTSFTGKRESVLNKLFDEITRPNGYTNHIEHFNHIFSENGVFTIKGKNTQMGDNSFTITLSIDMDKKHVLQYVFSDWFSKMLETNVPNETLEKWFKPETWEINVDFTVTENGFNIKNTKSNIGSFILPKYSNQPMVIDDDKIYKITPEVKCSMLSLCPIISQYNTLHEFSKTYMGEYTDVVLTLITKRILQESKAYGFSAFFSEKTNYTSQILKPDVSNFSTNDIQSGMLNLLRIMPYTQYDGLSQPTDESKTILICNAGMNGIPLSNLKNIRYTGNSIIHNGEIAYELIYHPNMELVAVKNGVIKILAKDMPEILKNTIKTIDFLNFNQIENFDVFEM